MSVLALALLTCLYFYKIEMSKHELSQGQYWGLIVIAVTTLSLLRQVSAFRIMLVGHAVGSVLFWSYLRFRSKNFEGHDGVAKFGMAVLVTLTGLISFQRE